MLNYESPDVENAERFTHEAVQHVEKVRCHFNLSIFRYGSFLTLPNQPGYYVDSRT